MPDTLAFSSGYELTNNPEHFHSSELPLIILLKILLISNTWCTDGNAKGSPGYKKKLMHWHFIVPSAYQNN
jgi:hypothetical protein